MDEMVRFPANRHSTSGYLATPASGRGPGLLVILEYWGLVDHIKRVADRFAQVGFVALAPDFFDGKTTTSRMTPRSCSWRSTLTGPAPTCGARATTS